MKVGTGGRGRLAAGNYLPLAQRSMVGRAGDLSLLCTKGEALGDLRGSALLLLTKVSRIMVGQVLLTQAGQMGTGTCCLLGTFHPTHP